MKTIHILLFSLCITSLSYGQKDMSIDLISSFDYAGLLDTPSLFTNANGELNDDTGISGIYTYRIGANFNFRVSKKIMIKSGLRYNNIGSKFYIDNLRWPSQIGPNGFDPTLDPSLPSFIHSITIHRFIEVPLIVRYEINSKRFNPFIEVGLSSNYYLNTKQSSKTNLTTSSTIENYTLSVPNFNSNQIAAVFSFGFNYDISDAIQIFLQPTFRYHINRIADNVNAPSTAPRAYSIGLEVGVRKRFGSYFD